MPMKTRKIVLKGTMSENRRKFKKKKPPEQVIYKRFGLDKDSIDVLFEREVAIDRTKLDLENAEHPRLHERWKRRYIAALNSYKELEARLQRTRAVVSGRIRRHPEDYHLNPDDRITEKALESALYLDAEYSKVAREFREAYIKLKELERNLDIIKERGYILGNLGTLLEQSYFTKTSMSYAEEEEKDG